jgi:hypothetical protein
VASTIAASAVVAANIFHLDMTFLPDRFFASSLDLATILSDIVALDMESAIAHAAIRSGERCPAATRSGVEPRLGNAHWAAASMLKLGVPAWAGRPPTRRCALVT